MPNAGFLFWDGGTFMPFSFMDFPLDVAELRRAAARKAAPPPEPKVEARPDTPRQEPEQRSRRRGRWVPISIVILLLLLAVPAYLFRDRWVPALPSFTRAPAAAPSALQLQVEAKGAGLNVRWDRQSPAIVRAREGRLWITESGGPPDIVELSIEDLKNGQVYYQSSADRLQFRLEVLDETGRLTRESVLALSSRRAAAPAAPGTPETTPPERQVRSVPVPEDLGSPALTPPAPPVRASRPFTPPSSGGASRPSDQQLVQDSPPAVVADSETAGGAGPPVPTGSASLPRAPSPSPAEPAGTQAVPAQPQPAPSAPQTFVPATYRPPVPKTQVRPPVTPSVRALLRKDVEISVQIEIDKTGKPVNALALSHDATLGGYLERASLAAAMQWRFEPARLGGQPVASAHKVMFVFRKP
jgi:protein TonB